MQFSTQRVITIFLILLIQVGLLASISPVEEERSKVLTYQEWLQQQAEKNQDADQQNADQESVDVIKKDSWADYHKSQTAKNILIKTDSQVKSLVYNVSSLFETEHNRTFQYSNSNQFISESISCNKPFLSGLAIGAP